MSLTGAGEMMTVVGLAALLYGEWAKRPAVRAVAKPLASLGFLVAAVGFGALDSSYGQLILIGLFFGAIGDVALLGRSRAAFIAGLVSFLLGHLAYVAAFVTLPISPPQAFLAAVAVTALMAFVARWVFPHAPEMRIPIAIYMVVIAAMCIVAIGAGAAGAPWMIPVGAVMFTLSDIAVVRDRFVSQGFVNRAWGLPLYYAAQLILAWSIAVVAAGA